MKIGYSIYGYGPKEDLFFEMYGLYKDGKIHESENTEIVRAKESKDGLYIMVNDLAKAEDDMYSNDVYYIDNNNKVQHLLELKIDEPDGWQSCGYEIAYVGSKYVVAEVSLYVYDDTKISVIGVDINNPELK